MKLALTLFFIARAWAASLQPNEAAVELDAARTKVHFTLSGSMHTVHGIFKLKDGSITFDPLNGHAGGQLVVDATSGESGSGARDRRMHKDILESAKFQEITFRPDHFDGHLSLAGDSDIQLHGMFSIHGVPHEMTLKMLVHVEGDRLAAKTAFAIPYAQWGMKNPSTFIFRVSDKVQIDLATEGKLKPQVTTETQTSH